MDPVDDFIQEEAAEDDVPPKPGGGHKRKSMRELFFPKSEGKLRRQQTQAFGVVTRKPVGIVFVGLILYGSLVFLFTDKEDAENSPVLPGSAVFGIVLLYVGARLGAEVAKLANLPKLLGQMLAGIFLVNIPGTFMDGFTREISSKIRAAGLACILLTGGLELEFSLFVRYGAPVARLTGLPAFCEATAVMLIGAPLFNMPFTVALALGFIIAAVSPAIVVTSMFALQDAGYGVAKGIPSMVITAASFDDVLAISGYTIVQSIAFGSGELIENILLGPANVILGLCLGTTGGAMCWCTQIWNSPLLRGGSILSVCMMTMFWSLNCMCRWNSFLGAGSMASHILGMVANYGWTERYGGCMALRLPQNVTSEFALECMHLIALVWANIMQPLLFGAIGFSLDFGKIEPATIPKALILLVACGLVRACAAFFSMTGAGLTARERAFVAISWMPKATVQAALGSGPAITVAFADYGDKQDDYVKWANDIEVVAALSILFTAPLGCVLINKLGPLMLENIFEESEDQTPDHDLRLQGDVTYQDAEGYPAQPDTDSCEGDATLPGNIDD